MEQILDALTTLDSPYVNVFLAVLRYVAPALVVIILWRCCKPLLTFRPEPEIWGFLVTKEGKKYPIAHWENVIGQHKRCDVVIDVPTVSRNHAVLTRYDDGSWTITDTGSKNGVFVNGKRVSISEIDAFDDISIGGDISRTRRSCSGRSRGRNALS